MSRPDSTRPPEGMTHRAAPYPIGMYDVQLIGTVAECRRSLMREIRHAASGTLARTWRSECRLDEAHTGKLMGSGVAGITRLG